VPRLRLANRMLDARVDGDINWDSGSLARDQSVTARCNKAFHLCSADDVIHYN